jgi:type II secretory pathway component PulC
MRPVVSLVFVIALAACGGAASRSVATSAAAAKPAPQAALAPPPEHTLPRAVVRDVVAQGLGSFLQHIEVADQPVLAAGKFHGFRVAVLHDTPFWQGVDLKPGDVVTSVNGFPIEHPEQAQTAFDSLEVSSELRVAYERNGQPRELVYAIVEGP